MSPDLFMTKHFACDILLLWFSPNTVILSTLYLACLLYLCSLKFTLLASWGLDFYFICLLSLTELPRWLSGKEPACQCRRHGLNPWVGKIPWRRKWQSTPEFLPGKSHGQRSPEGYSPWGHKRVWHDLETKHQQYSHCIIDFLVYCI